MRTPLGKTMIAAVLVLMGIAAQAQTTATGSAPPVTQTGTTEPVNASPAVASTPTDKLIARFSTFSGSEENAASLVNGLRTGSEITLTGSSASGSSSESASFTSPTKPMGYGNIRIALSLAEAQLATEGITQPTPQQLQTALMGDMTGATAQTTSQTQGILQMRASGMGWGQIANAMGFKLGAVMSGRVPANTATTTQSGTNSGTVTATGTTASASSKGQSARASGIVTANGRPAGGNGVHQSDTSRGQGSAASSSGIVTATGASAGGGAGRNHGAFNAAGNANGHAAAAGSGSASSSGAVSAQGAGRGAGNAYGHSK
jgi:hypothetical protein